jgi:hypothetical protein
MNNEMNVPDFLPVLSHGSHGYPTEGACVMEMVSFLAGERFSDDPECVNYIIKAQAISINDLVSDDNRNQIALMIPRFMNTQDLNDNLEFTKEAREARVAFLEAHELDCTDTVAQAVRKAFANDEGDMRRTNQEYDQIGIDWLNVLLDIADKHLGRDTTPDYSVYVPKMREHVSQVNA